MDDPFARAWTVRFEIGRLVLHLRRGPHDSFAQGFARVRGEVALAAAQDLEAVVCAQCLKHAAPDAPLAWIW